VKFLLDQDVPDDLTYLLRELNHEVFRLRDALPVEATDSAVLNFAHEHDCLLVTCNRDDFIKLAQTQRHRGIVVIIRRKTRAAERAALLRLLERAGESGLKDNINFA
jgi:predicted nuclease of predicted toxin-antitoxin system